MAVKKRLDCLLVEQGFIPSREQAKIVIMEGKVYVDHQKCDKPGSTFPENSVIEVRGETLAYVSRGGLKLEKALQTFPITLTDKITMDIGASTGGFTDCMLQNGARKVYAIDVGYGQLAWKLRTDERVVNLERTNVRYLTQEQVPELVDFFSVDVAFISLRLVLPVAYRFLKQNGEAVCLIKPQFEAGRDKVGKKGVVRDPKIHLEVIDGILSFVQSIGFSLLGLTYSPIKGPEGNIEYLLYVKKTDPVLPVTNLPEIDVTNIVETAHRSLNA